MQNPEILKQKLTNDKTTDASLMIHCPVEELTRKARVVDIKGGAYYGDELLFITQLKGKNITPIPYWKQDAVTTAICETDRARVVLSKALRMLVDTQNGPPLIREEDKWNEAMAQARLALAEHENTPEDDA